MIEHIEIIFERLLNICILMLEFAGFCIIMQAAIKSIIMHIKKKEHCRVILAEGIALGLSFMLGGEILHSIVARDLQEAIQLGVIVAMRICITLLINWELKAEEEEIKVQIEQEELEHMKENSSNK